MDLRIGFGLALYYTLLSLIFLGLNGFADEFDQVEIDATSNIDINSSAVTSGEVDQGGFFTIGVSFSRFLNWTGFTVFLPGATPEWFVLIFGVFQTLFNIVAIMWIINSVWAG